MSAENENITKGGITVEAEHIFPVIKRWLYSEKEIFLREIVSNACDAVTKLRRLSSLGEVRDLDDSEFRIDVRLDRDARTITVSDNGIGMNREEVEKFICQIALSGAVDFISKYENTEGGAPGIIGHFGLGFYSAFMVSDSVELITRSYTGAPAVRWVCSEAGDYEMSEGEREGRGTDVIMHVSEEGSEYLSELKLRDILDKYCSFMPVPIYFESVKTKAELEEEAKKAAEAKAEGKDGDKDEHEHGDGCSCDECSGHEHEEKPINDTNPLWQRRPSDCTEEDYKEFYTRVFHDWKEPLFHIHINADYPLNFKGILYFPRIGSEFESLEGQVKLYYNQVFVADNIKEVIPEYMLMLKGVLDCPELPLNVSRSYLQNNAYVSKVSAHIVKKVCDKLTGMFNTDRKAYEKLWSDLKVFVEYACLRDRKFYDRVKSALLLPLTSGGFRTVDEYLEAAKAKHENTVYYATDKAAQAQYISMFESEGIEVALLDKVLDTQYINVIESDRNVKFVRIDADVADALKGDGEKYENKALEELFKKVSGSDRLTVRCEALRDESVPALLNISEQTRRMDDMMRMYRMSGGEDGGMSMPLDATLVLNSNSKLIRALGDAAEAGANEHNERVAKQVYTLALLAQRQLSAEELKSFLSGSFSLLEEDILGENK